MIPTKSSEFEVKLLFPDNKLEPIEQWIISKGGVRRQHLQAAYIDTPHFLLTQAGIAFRLRKEGRKWIQTLKVSTNNPLERLEHNIVLEATGNAIPKWDLDLHHHDKSGQLLKKRLPKLKADDLQICYQTDIWRRRAVIKTPQGELEYALDRGSIYSLIPGSSTSTPVQELEIELKEGDSHEVLNHVQKIIKRYGAFIDTRSKSERGYLLASGLEFSPPARAKFISLKGVGDNREIISRLINSCMQQVLANQSVLNTEFKHYPEYLHQLRVGLRRLKTLLKYLEAGNTCIGDEWIAVFKRVFGALGQYRDNDYVSHILNPTLLSLGGPEIKLDDIAELPSPSCITGNKEFQLLLVKLMSLGLAQATPIGAPVEDGSAKEGKAIFKKKIAKMLNSRFRFISNQAPKFASLQDEEIHSMRKKMKFMRYSLEFFRDYCIKKAYPKFLKALTVTLDYFGLFNDICVAIDRIESRAKSDPSLLFALGWLKAERQRVRGLCGKSLKQLIQMGTPWEE